MWKKLICSLFNHKNPYIESPWFIKCRRCRAIIRRKTAAEYLKETGKL